MERYLPRSLALLFLVAPALLSACDEHQDMFTPEPPQTPHFYETPTPSKPATDSQEGYLPGISISITNFTRDVLIFTSNSRIVDATWPIVFMNMEEK